MARKKAAISGHSIDSIVIKNPIDIIRYSQKGLTKGILIRIGALLALKQAEMAELASLSLRSFQRYSEKDKLSPAATENLIHILAGFVRAIS